MSSIPDRLSAALEGRYRIERELGAGGMATVYLAEDLKHDRKVAIKVLRPELAAVVGAERFLAEIRTTAKLQHPHILPLHDSGEAGGFLFYVMPYVGGESLREKLDREKQLRVDEAIDYARKVGDALDYAHEKGVVHRDIKPANILLSERGEPLVADFGIALAVSQAGEGRITETGLSLGTPHYMSPEQATGDRDVDPRSDVYALGCVMYEMLAGQPPFAAPTAQAVLARILTETPRRVTEMRRTVPPHVASVIAKSLEKLPADRFASVREMTDALAQEGFTYVTEVSSAPGAPSGGRTPSSSGPTRSGVGAILAFVATGAVLATAVFASIGLLGTTADSGRTEGTAPVRTDPALPADFEWLATSRLRISPTGEHVAIYGSVGDASGVWIRRLSDPEFRLIQDTEDGWLFTFSPDGTELAVGLGADGGIHRMEFDGGNRREITTEDAIALDWGDDDRLYMIPPLSFSDQRLMRVPASGAGDPESLAEVSAIPFAATSVEVLPGGSGVLVAQFDLTGGRPRTSIWKEGSDSFAILLENALEARYVETGHIVFSDLEGDLRAAPFDPDRLEVTGSSIELERRVGRPAPPNVRFDVANGGTLVYSEGSTTTIEDVFDGTALAEITLDGTHSDVLPGLALGPRWSPAGDRILFASGSTFTDVQLRIYDPVLAVRPRPIAGDVDVSVSGVWAPDASQVAFVGGANFQDLRPRVVEVAGVASRPLPGPVDDDGREPVNVAPVDWTAAGIVWGANSGPTRGLYLQSDTSRPASLWLEAPIAWARVSPQGDYIAYVEEGSGTDDGVLWARSFPDIGPPVRISEGGAEYAVWSPSGSAIYFTRGVAGWRELRRARLTRDPVLAVLDETTVIDSLGVALGGMDLHPGGTRFVTGLQGRNGESASLTSEPQLTPDRSWIVLNWFDRIEDAFSGEGR